MDPETFVDPQLTFADHVVLQRLLGDLSNNDDGKVSKVRVNGEVVGIELGSTPPDSGYESNESDLQLPKTELRPEDVAESVSQLRNRQAKGTASTTTDNGDAAALDVMRGANNPKDERFEPTVFVMWDISKLNLPNWLDNSILQPYIRLGKAVVRHPTDVVFLTHFIMYMTTSVPSALFLYYRFSYVHAVLHWLMQSWYVGSYTLMMHQHIHQRGILKPAFAWLDACFPYVTDPLMGHTWNSYFYHHVKHHHVEGNGPNDLSSTIRYQRDDPWHFAHYVGRFLLLTWIELPLYFARKAQVGMAAKAAFSELSSYTFMFCMARFVSFKATMFVFILPFSLLRLGLMVGNWGQHALVDEVDPDSDFRSSITLIDVPSNRYSFNDGYHTSHHLNPLRHWREHPVSFLQQRQTYADQHALVFRNIDYVFLTVRVLMKDYDHLAKCLVPIGDQIGMSRAEIAAMLRTKTKKMDEQTIEAKFGVK